jgi:hypothetical protein
VLLEYYSNFGLLFSTVKRASYICSHRESSSLIQPLPVPTVTGLTRFQSLFSILTSINVHVLSIETKGEFFLFMDMREELGCVSYDMTSHRWVLVVVNYYN